VDSVAWGMVYVGVLLFVWMETTYLTFTDLYKTFRPFTMLTFTFYGETFSDLLNLNSLTKERRSEKYS
jgi:hypothetical protein